MVLPGLPVAYFPSEFFFTVFLVVNFSYCMCRILSRSSVICFFSKKACEVKGVKPKVRLMITWKEDGYEVDV